jgi:acetate kinase
MEGTFFCEAVKSAATGMLIAAGGRESGMHILVINSGSSSIKFSVFAAEGTEIPRSLLDGELSGIGTPGATLRLKPEAAQPMQASDLNRAVDDILTAVSQHLKVKIGAIGYRVVHPGAKLAGHQRITPEMLADLEGAVAFAPLHDPAVLQVIKAGMERYPGLPHFACFDTAFHRTMPEEATTYAIPKEYREQGVRRYGFHGLSCESVVWQLQQAGPVPPRLVIAHLGSGCSVTAVLDTVSVDTSMGLTPTGGVVMGTRPGDLDPGLVLYLLRQQTGEDPASAVETMLNHEAGTVALSGMPNDMKAVRKAASDGDQAAVLALKVFTRSVRKAIGSYAWLLGGVDAIVLTGGIGEHDAMSRAEILGGLEGLGVSLDAAANEASAAGVRCVTRAEAEIAVWVVPAEEDLMIARHVVRLMGS